ncbi:MAG: phosphatidate cytidylyltransferase [Dictyoglomaceae bacterium]|nr:phosphatidate cytidylyltransferase [Dictyoglomaceae bacterium]
MIERIITGLWGIPLILWTIHMGDQVLFIFVMVLVGFGLWEFYTLLEKYKFEPLKLEGIILGLLYITFIYFGSRRALIIFLPLLILVLLIYELFRKKKAITDLSLTFLGFFYIPFLLGYLLMLRSLPQGEKFCYFTFILVWISDTSAFFIGKAMGKHPLAPSISPKKTIEGTIAGIVFSGLASLIFPFFYSWRPLFTLILGIAVGIMGQLGDLVESMLKREIGVKDASSLLPGHGGVLDRFDSLLFAIPTVYYFLSLLRL